MRKFLLSAVALTGIAVTVQVAGAAPAEAQPVFHPQAGNGLIQTVQYRDWRWRERERRHEEWRWRRHAEWRHHHDQYRY